MPYALAAEPAGALYIADLRNFRIRCLQSPQAPPQPAPNLGTPIVNSASYAGPAAPGALVSIFGENLARGAASATAVPASEVASPDAVCLQQPNQLPDAAGRRRRRFDAG